MSLSLVGAFGFMTQFPQTSHWSHPTDVLPRQTHGLQLTRDSGAPGAGVSQHRLPGWAEGEWPPIGWKVPLLRFGDFAQC